MKINIGMHKDKEVIFDKNLANNSHMVLLGATGSGKTTEMIRLMIEIVKNGGTVLAFDTNNIFSDSQIHKGYLADFKKYLREIDVYNDGIKVPLFEALTFSDGTVEKDVDIMDSITEAFATTFEFGVKQKATLRNAICIVANKNLYSEFGIKAVSGVLADMKTLKSLEVRERISQITDHNVFVDGEFFIEEGKINLIRISKFSDDTQLKIMEIMSAILWKYASKEKFVDNGVYLAFDECQNLAHGKNSMIAKILREGRRFNLNLLLSTQVLAQDAQITKLMTQAALILNFKPAKSEIKKVAELIDNTNIESWMVMLHRLNRGEFVASGQLVYDDKIIKVPLVVTAVIDENNKIKEQENVELPSITNEEVIIEGAWSMY